MTSGRMIRRSSLPSGGRVARAAQPLAHEEQPGAAGFAANIITVRRMIAAAAPSAISETARS